MISMGTGVESEKRLEELVGESIRWKNKHLG
jgi:hypothetical protein